MEEQLKSDVQGKDFTSVNILLKNLKVRSNLQLFLSPLQGSFKFYRGYCKYFSLVLIIAKALIYFVECQEG